MASTATVRLKLLIDTKGNRVVFAESGKEFVDFLFTILSLPVGTVIRLLTKQAMVGSLGSLYDSIENMSETYIQPNQSKDSILNPKVDIVPSSSSSSSNIHRLLPNIKPPAASSTSTTTNTTTTTTTTMFYTCTRHWYETNAPNAKCPQCGVLMSRKMTLVEPQTNQGLSGSSSSFDEGGYVRGVVMYMITDDLGVRPMPTMSSITTMLNKLNVKEVGALEEKVVELTMDEGVKLLKAAMQSKNVLTDVFLKNRNIPVAKKEGQAESTRTGATSVSNKQQPRTAATNATDVRKQQQIISTATAASNKQQRPRTRAATKATEAGKQQPPKRPSDGGSRCEQPETTDMRNQRPRTSRQGRRR